MTPPLILTPEAGGERLDAFLARIQPMLEGAADMEAITL